MPSTCPSCGRVKTPSDPFCSRQCALDAPEEDRPNKVGLASPPSPPEHRDKSQAGFVTCTPPSPPASVPIKRPRCVRSDCRCTGTWNDEAGEYCCRTCRDGRPCRSDIHGSSCPSSSRSRGNEKEAGGGGPPAADSTEDEAARASKCRRATCPCPGTWNGEAGEYCSQRCRRGQPCSHPTHGVAPEDEPLLFYHRTQPFYELTNFAPAPIVIHGDTWPTSEHYFQAQKFVQHPEAMAVIRGAATPLEAFRLTRTDEFSAILREDWDEVKEAVMKEALVHKFTQHEDLRALLLSTGRRPLVEHTRNDAYWGDAGGGEGKNRLGALLMEVREMLEEEEAASRSRGGSSEKMAKATGGEGQKGRAQGEEVEEEGPDAMDICSEKEDGAT